MASVTPSPALLTEQAPADSATLEAWAEEGRLLRRARQLVESDPGHDECCESAAGASRAGARRARLTAENATLVRCAGC